MDIPLFTAFKRSLKQGKLPQYCMMCAEPSHQRICHHCEAYWPLQHHCCQQCSLPLRQHALICGDCLKHPPNFDYTYAPYLYDAPLSTLILDFKTQGNLPLGIALCDYWQQRLRQHILSQHQVLPDYLAPVPSHWRRQWQRGFSHTHFCAEQLSRYFAIPVFNHSRMIKQSDMQKSLTRKQRLHALSSAFTIDKPLNGKSIAIIDDVMTTGATANAFAKVLHVAGAANITVWVLARTPRQR